MGILIKTEILFPGTNSVVAPKYFSIPIMSDKKCLKSNSIAIRKGRMCTSSKEQKIMCDVRY